MNSVTTGYGLAKAGRNKLLFGASFQIYVACRGSDKRRSCQASYSQRSTALSVLRSCNTIATSLNVPVVMSHDVPSSRCYLLTWVHPLYLLCIVIRVLPNFYEFFTQFY